MTTKTRKTYIGKERDDESYLGDFGVRKYDYASGRFTSPDVLWEKYINWSPYHYCGNNPISLIDPSGKEYFITGAASKEAIDDLNREMSGANFSINSSGLVEMQSQYVAQNAMEVSFLENMRDPAIDSKLLATDKASCANPDGGPPLVMVPGSYLGASQGVGSKIEGHMALNIEFSRRHNLVGGTSSGLNIMHELLEGFFGAKTNGVHSYSATIQKAAHQQVMSLDPRQKDGVGYGRGVLPLFNPDYYYVQGPKGKVMELFDLKTPGFPILPRGNP